MSSGQFSAEEFERLLKVLDAERLAKLIALGKALVGTVATMAVAAFTLGVQVRQQQADLDKIRSDLAAVTVRVTAIEVDRNNRIGEYQRTVADLQSQLVKTQTDVSWIRQALERANR